jgi:hypothetical protein
MSEYMHEGRTGMHDVLPYQIDWPALIAEPSTLPTLGEAAERGAERCGSAIRVGIGEFLAKLSRPLIKCLGVDA